MKAWLEIAIGDKDVYDNQLAAYNRAAEFLSKIGMQIGVLAEGREVCSPSASQSFRSEIDFAERWPKGWFNEFS